MEPRYSQSRFSSGYGLRDPQAPDQILPPEEERVGPDGARHRMYPAPSPVKPPANIDDGWGPVPQDSWAPPPQRSHAVEIKRPLSPPSRWSSAQAEPAPRPSATTGGGAYVPWPAQDSVQKPQNDAPRDAPPHLPSSGNGPHGALGGWEPVKLVSDSVDEAHNKIEAALREAAERRGETYDPSIQHFTGRRFDAPNQGVGGRGPAAQGPGWGSRGGQQDSGWGSRGSQNQQQQQGSGWGANDNSTDNAWGSGKAGPGGDSYGNSENTCYNCGKPGHFRAECPEGGGRGGGGGGACYGCGETGHMRADCPQGGNNCFNCGQPGHIRAECPEGGGRGGGGGACYGCGETGHMRSDCPQGSSAFRGTCHNCGESGHMRSNCPQNEGSRGGGYGSFRQNDTARTQDDGWGNTANADGPNDNWGNSNQNSDHWGQSHPGNNATANTVANNDNWGQAHPGNNAAAHTVANNDNWGGNSGDQWGGNTANHQPSSTTPAARGPYMNPARAQMLHGTNFEGPPVAPNQHDMSNSNDDCGGW